MCHIGVLIVREVGMFFLSLFLFRHILQVSCVFWGCIIRRIMAIEEVLRLAQGVGTYPVAISFHLKTSSSGHCEY